MAVWLRATKYDDGNAMTFVAAPGDLAKDIHQIANDTRVQFGGAVDVEIFQFPGTLEAATAEAAKRSKTRLTDAQRFRDALHDFLIATFIVSKAQTLITPELPIPMDAETAKAVLLEVLQHPSYKGQIVMLKSSDKKGVMLEKNTVMVKDSI